MDTSNSGRSSNTSIPSGIKCYDKPVLKQKWFGKKGQIHPRGLQIYSNLQDGRQAHRFPKKQEKCFDEKAIRVMVRLSGNLVSLFY